MSSLITNVPVQHKMWNRIVSSENGNLLWKEKHFSILIFLVIVHQPYWEMDEILYKMREKHTALILDINSVFTLFRTKLDRHYVNPQMRQKINILIKNTINRYTIPVCLFFFSLCEYSLWWNNIFRHMDRII